jgi:hypothetical protein
VSFEGGEVRTKSSTLRGQKMLTDTVVTPAVEYAFECVVWTGSEGDVVDDRYCNGNVDV